MNLVEIVVGGHPSGVRIIGRELNGSEVISFHAFGDDNDTARMLTGGTFDIDTARGDVVNLSVSHFIRVDS